jgi:NAD(P)-dependent dehydrogenase (short-subunit alcohol dehydrogenase family)
MADKPLIYVVLGAAGSGRREIVADLVEAGLAEGDRAAVLLSSAEAPDAADARLPGLARWTWAEDHIEGTIPEGATHVFFVTDGRTNPVDQLEVCAPWIEAQGAELGRILCVVNCALAEKSPQLLPWFEACVHFSDVVLLTRRESVANKWLSEFRAHFDGRFYPCLFELVKNGRVKNPALVLDPLARRMSHAFDLEQDWVFTDSEGDEIDEDEESESNEDVEVTAEVEPYFVRDAAQRREKKIPDIAKYLPPVA